MTAIALIHGDFVMTTEKPEALKALNERLDAARTELKSAAEKIQESVKSFASKAEQNGQTLRAELTKLSEKVRAEGISETAKNAAKEASVSIKDLSNKVVSSLGLASSEELTAMHKKVDSLSRKIRKLEKSAA